MTILGAALLVNGVAWGALLAAPALLLVRKPRAKACNRSAVQLALRLARAGERTLLVDSPDGVRLERVEEAGPGLQFVGALAGGALILARRR